MSVPCHWRRQWGYSWKKGCCPQPQRDWNLSGKMVTALPPYFSTSCLGFVSKHRHLEKLGKEQGIRGLHVGLRPRTQKGPRDAESKKRKEVKAIERLRKAYTWNKKWREIVWKRSLEALWRTRQWGGLKWQLPLWAAGKLAPHTSLTDVQNRRAPH